MIWGNVSIVERVLLEWGVSNPWGLLGIALPRDENKLAWWECILGATAVSVALVVQPILLGSALVLMLIGLKVAWEYIVEACLGEG